MDRKIALVTGGNRGIGAAICLALARSGYFVYVNDIARTDETEPLLAQIKEQGDGAFLQFDVCREGSITSALAEFAHDRLDLLVNNAGILRDNLLSTTETKDYEALLETNFYGVCRTYDVFREKLSASRCPVVASMGSISGVRVRAGQNGYAVSKAMVIEWTLQKSLAEHHIKFFALSPGAVATEMIKKAPWYNQPGVFKIIPLGRFAEPEEIGEFILMLSERPQLFQNGSNIIIDGGFIQTVKEKK
ncbi:MAG: SDR family oxidoreductase [Desulfobacter sp.]